MTRRVGRRTPYTARGIARVPCCRCGAPSVHQWQACANDRRFVGVCTACDVALNALALRFMRVPGAGTLLARYRKRLGVAPAGRSRPEGAGRRC